MAEQAIDARLDRIVDTIAEDSGVERFALCGGVILDTLLGRPVADYDIVIEADPSRKDLNQLAGTLAGHGYSVPVLGRPYFVKIHTPTTLVEAVKDDTVLDIGFAPSYDVIPYFKIDSAYYTYPEKEQNDNFDVMGAFRRQDLSLARGIDEENPFMITARLLNLSAKYDIPLQRADDLLQELSQCMRKWEPPHDFHVRAAQSAAQSTLKAIARSSAPQAFAHSLLEMETLREIFPEAIPVLGSLLDRPAADWPTTKRELLACIIETTNHDNQQHDMLVRRLGSIVMNQQEHS